jgi:hypothetical protein
VEFADGRKATSLDRGGMLPEEETAKPVLARHGGSADETLHEQHFGLAPVPPAGPMWFVCEWPAFDVPVTKAEVDASVIRHAASRALVVWPGDD